MLRGSIDSKRASRRPPRWDPGIPREPWIQRNPCWNFGCRTRIREFIIPKMFARTISRLVVLAALTLQMFAFVADAAICKPGHAEPAAGCPSYSETAPSPSSCSREGRAESSSHAQDPEKKQCSVCPFCLAPFIEASPVSVSSDDRVQRFTPPDYATLYEAPSSSLLRPPIV
jgi:hypothetical protein